MTADGSVRSHLLSDLPGVAENALTASAMQFIDTAGAGYDEEPEPDGESRRNPREADLVCRKVRALLDAGLSPRVSDPSRKADCQEPGRRQDESTPEHRCHRARS